MSLMGFLKRGTQALLVVAAGLACLILGSLFIRETPTDPVLSERIDDRERPLALNFEPAKDVGFDEYAAVINGRDLFAAPNEKIFVSVDQDMSGANLDAALLVSGGFQLLGIVLDEDPMIMIHDTKQQKTLFLGTGDRLGEAVVKEILDGKVIFEYQGRSVEMTP